MTLNGATCSEDIQSIENASITLQYGDIQYFTKTDNKGEFEFFKNIPKGAWSIKVVHPKYTCLIVDDVVQYGGQWINFRIQQKDKSSN
jgi:uncharacterized GH25 family protein